MAAPKLKTKGEKLLVWSTIAKMERRGHTQTQIAQVVGLSHVMVGNILRELKARYREEIQTDTVESTRRKIAQLDEVIREAWEGYERSKEDEERTLEESKLRHLFSEPVKDKKTGRVLTKPQIIGAEIGLVKSIKETKGRLPCGSYLQIIMDALWKQAELEGLLDKDVDINVTKVVINWGDLEGGPPERTTAEEIEDVIAGAGQAALPPITVEGRSVDVNVPTGGRAEAEE